MSYPTPEKWRSFAAHAQSMADEYRAEGREADADRREADAEFYLSRAELEELCIARRQAQNNERMAA